MCIRDRATIVTHRVQRLRTVRERRWLHGVQLHSGVWVGNLHAGATVREARLAADTMRDWASGAPAVLGGDFNLHAVALAGFAWAAGHEPDHILVTGGLWPEPGSAAVLDHGTLSDHAPVAVTLTPGA